MKVGVYGQSNNENTKKYINILVDLLITKNVEVVFEENFYNYYKKTNEKNSHNTFTNYYDLNATYDMFFSVGGDGTFLRSVTFIRDLGIPIIGINTGRLGFLATIQKENIQDAVTQILNNNYSIKERSLLSVNTNNNTDSFSELNFALNEISISRKNTASMITIKTHLDEEYLTTYWSDGLIISTPTGSTGYSLSCGGPIISPSSKNIVLTPIAPHSLSVRPLVIPDETKIELQIGSRTNEALLTLDSRIITVNNTTKIFITKCNFSIKIIHLNQQSFIKTLREKLFWGEDKRN